MFLEKYVDEFYLNEIINTYNEDYLLEFDEENFDKIYRLFQANNFYFIEDIILKYIEIFAMNYEDVYHGLVKLRNTLGENYVFIIGNDMSLLSVITQKESEN